MPSTHVIRRQILDVELAGTESDGFALQHKLMTFCQDWLMPALDRMLERALPADQHWTLDRLEIDAGAIRLETLERDLVDAVSHAMERRVKDLVPRAVPWSSSDDIQARASAIERQFEQSVGQMSPLQPVERRTGTQAAMDALAHFLTTGLLPWWFSLPPGETLEDVVRGSWQVAPEKITGAGRTLMAALASSAARTRLIRQFSVDFLALLLARVAEEKVPVVREVLAELDRHHATPEALGLFRALVWQAAFAPGGRHTAGALAAAALHEATAENIERMAPSLLEGIGRVWPEARGDRIADRASRRALEPDAAADRSEAGARTALEEGVFFSGAGIVLLHPFLPRLFEGLGIAANDKLIAPERALGLLHFLATGQAMAPEYELLLPKILCNLPLDVPAAAPAELTTAEMEEADALLSAVIGHWTALGDTSVDGLRGSFLARPGKLSRRSAEDLLQVEPRSYDILLDRLPWGIGMIQLPWMEKICGLSGGSEPTSPMCP